MVRAPCCEKMGLKKGPWTSQEDHVLVTHINLHGHGNWRALPKQAGLLRCGKSCRLRWTNYLRPDIKRGNFSREEEETIINLHQTLGNKWSAIAARLPGRTDNEIKNVWHTHLKKRPAPKTTRPDSKTTLTPKQEPHPHQHVAASPLHDRSRGDASSSSSTVDTTLPETDDDFWLEVLLAATEDCPDTGIDTSVRYDDVFKGAEFWFERFTRQTEDIILFDLQEMQQLNCIFE